MVPEIAMDHVGVWNGENVIAAQTQTQISLKREKLCGTFI